MTTAVRWTIRPATPDDATVVADLGARTFRQTYLDETNAADLDCGVVVIEHDMRMVMGLCDRIQVLDHGKTIALDTPSRIRNDPAVVAAYFRTSGDGFAPA